MGYEYSFLSNSPQGRWLYSGSLDFFSVTQTFEGEGNGNPLQYSCLKTPMDGGDWWAAVHGATKSQTRLNDFTYTFHFHALEKEMATHSSILAWRIPGTGEPGGLPSMGSHRVRHDWSDLAAVSLKRGLFFSFLTWLVHSFFWVSIQISLIQRDHSMW